MALISSNRVRSATMRTPIMQLALIIASQIPGGISQITTNAACQSSMKWMFNSKEQSPCLVGGFLMSTCMNGEWNVVSVNATTDDVYPGPVSSQSATLNCGCNTVAYSLFSACGYCQGASYLRWLDWSQECPSTQKQVFPNEIPSNTAVPQWAFLDVTVSGNWSPSNALSVGDLPENSVAPSSTSTTSSSSSQTSAGNSAMKGAGLSSGAIAGIVIGVVILSALIVAGLVLRKRRQRSRQHHSQQTTDSPQSALGGNGDMAQTAAHSYPAENVAEVQSWPTRYYDPNDPTTFPPSFSRLGHRDGGLPVASTDKLPEVRGTWVSQSSSGGSSGPVGRWSG